jgi:RNA polymerase sigma factor (sigma-70 family)
MAVIKAKFGLCVASFPNLALSYLAWSGLASMVANDASLARLMAMVQQGDKLAYVTLLGECRTWLARYFSKRIAPAAVDDLVQETLISLHRKRATYEPSRPFLPWLAAIARYRWVDQLRKTYRADETELVAELSVASEESGIIARISIDRLLEQIPVKQSDVIRMVKIDGLSISEAALRSGQSEPLVKVNIHRGLKKLAALVERE